ncbi:MAG: rubrerythrin, partial [Microvirga sp.]|nr:rubrerythrin [Microvirga sp.]
MKSLSELSEREVVALAIASEEEDSRIYQNFADRLRPDFPASAEIFDGMAEEEREHRNSLYNFYRSRCGEHLPTIRREDVRGFLKRRAVWW